jgi:hypothetical protein
MTMAAQRRRAVGQFDRSAGVLTRSTRKLESAVEDSQCVAFATRCGWDSRAPKNCKLTHYQAADGLANANIISENAAGPALIPTDLALTGWNVFRILARQQSVSCNTNSNWS